LRINTLSKKDRKQLFLGFVSAALGVSKTFGNRDKFVVLLALDVRNNPRNQLFNSFLVNVVLKSNMTLRILLAILLDYALVISLFMREARLILVSPIVRIDIPKNDLVTKFTKSGEGGAIIFTRRRAHVKRVLAKNGSKDLFELGHFRLNFR
jgi:hypothetical protein